MQRMDLQSHTKLYISCKLPKEVFQENEFCWVKYGTNDKWPARVVKIAKEGIKVRYFDISIKQYSFRIIKDKIWKKEVYKVEDIRRMMKNNNMGNRLDVAIEKAKAYYGKDDLFDY